jgi:hypothetical protein
LRTGAAAFLMKDAALFASAAFSKPSIAEYLRPPPAPSNSGATSKAPTDLKLLVPLHFSSKYEFVDSH